MKRLGIITNGIFASSVIALLHASTSMAQGSIQRGMEAARGDTQPVDLFGDGGMFTTVVNMMLFGVGAVAVIMIIIGGFRYVISGGDAKNVTAAKNTILYAIIGIIVALLSYAILDFVVQAFTMGGNNSGL